MVRCGWEADNVGNSPAFMVAVTPQTRRHTRTGSGSPVSGTTDNPNTWGKTGH